MPDQSITVPLKATRLSGEPVEFADIDKKDEKPRFKMNAYSGKVIPGHWFWGNLIIDLAGMKLPKKKMPVLQDHFTEKIVGWSEKIRKSDEGVLIEGNFAESTQSGQEAMALAREGFPWQASVYVPPSSIEDVSEGTKVEINGQKLKGPLTIFRKTELKEASFCALGADSNTSAEALKDSGNIQVPITNTKKGGNKQMELTLDILKKDHGDLIDALSAEIAAGITIDNFEEDVAKLKEDISKESAKAERERILGIFGQAYGEDMTAKFGKIVEPDANMEDLMAFAQEKAKQDILTKMTKDAPETAGAVDGDSIDSLSNLVGEEKWKAEFAKSKDLQDEFGGNIDRYLAFKKAEGEGKVRILKSKTA